jgi:ribokinase
MVLKNFKINRVDTRGVLIQPNERTFFCVVLIDPSGEKALISAPTGCMRPLEEISEEYIATASHLHTNVRNPKKLAKAVQIAKKHGLTISLDLDACKTIYKDNIWELLANIDILFINQRGAINLTGIKEMEKAIELILNHTENIVCITLGSQGSMIATSNETFLSPAFKVKTVDTTGAGDCFAAGFIHGFLSDWPLDYSATFANAVAAICITSFGGHTGSPTPTQVKKFLISHRIEPLE